MSTWALLLIPTALIVTSALLALTAWLETRILSPQALIVSAARARGGEPEQVEAFVTQQYDLIARNRAEIEQTIDSRVSVIGQTLEV